MENKQQILGHLVTNISTAIQQINSYADTVKEIKVLGERIWIVGSNHSIVINQPEPEHQHYATY